MGRSYGGSWVISAPSSTIRPSLGFSKPASIRSRVDLPEPEPPSNAKISPRRIDRLTSSTASTPSKRLLTRRISIKPSSRTGRGLPVGKPADCSTLRCSDSGTRLHPVPDTRMDTLNGKRLVLGDIQVVHHLLVRIDSRVVENIRVEEFVGRHVGIGIDHVLGNAGGYFRLKQEIDERMGVVRVRGIGGDRQHVEPQRCTLFGNNVVNGEIASGLGGTVGSLEHITRVTRRHADFAIGEIRDIARRVEVGHVVAYGSNQLAGRLKVSALFGKR